MARVWLRMVAMVPALAVLLAVACTSDPAPEETAGSSPTSEATSRATASGAPWVPLRVTRPPDPTATPEPTAEPTPGPPYLERFERGEVIDVAPAVVFGDVETGEAEAWVVPETGGGEFVVSPSGSFVVYPTAGGFKLLRTEDGATHSLDIGGWPVEVGPGDSGFIAVDSGGFTLSAYDGEGRRIQDLWRSAPGMGAVASWSEDGSIAVGQNNTGSAIAVSVWAAPDRVPQASGDEFRAAVPEGSSIALEWSPDGELVAVVTSDAVYALDRDNDLVWAVEGEFFGNPRWSPDGEHLAVNAMPSIEGHDGRVGVTSVTYLLSRDGTEVFRVNGAGDCSVNPWISASSLVVGGYLVTVDGAIRRYALPSPSVWVHPASQGFELKPGLGFHLPHIAWRGVDQRLADGRMVFTTPEIGHGGCGTIVGASEWPAIEVERPPYDEVRSGVVVALESLADEPTVARVVDAVQGPPADRQIDRMLELAHRYQALCSFHGELFDHCEAAGLGTWDTFAGIPFALRGCEGCLLPLELARREITDAVDGSRFVLDAVWRLPALESWPYSELSGAEQQFAIWLTRADWRAQRIDEPIGVLLIVDPEVERPIVGIERHHAGWTGHDTSALFGTWEAIFLARPVEPRD